MRIEEQYADVLHSIELAIVATAERKSSVVDRDVLTAIDALLRHYEHEKRNRPGLVPMPSGRALAVFEQCRPVCEWHVGRETLRGGEPYSEDARSGELSVVEVMHCLKRLRKSVRLWHKRGGHRGYLTYVQGFLQDAAAQSRI